VNCCHIVTLQAWKETGILLHYPPVMWIWHVANEWRNVKHCCASRCVPRRIFYVIQYVPLVGHRQCERQTRPWATCLSIKNIRPYVSISILWRFKFHRVRVLSRVSSYSKFYSMKYFTEKFRALFAYNLHTY